MALNLGWVKEHKVAVAGVVLGAIVLIYVAKRSGGSSSSSGIAGAIGAQQQGQLQMAQLNAQLTAQGDQTQAQLEAAQISANAQTQQQQNQVAEQIALYGLQGNLQSEALTAQEQYRTALLPAIQSITSVDSKTLRDHQYVAQTLQNELALLLSQGSASGLPSVIPGQQSAQSGFNLNIPGIGNLGIHG